MRVVIIGAGITGLAAAHFLRARCRAAGRPLSLTVLERTGRAGGLIRSEVRDGCTLEAGPDSFLTDQPAMRQLLRDLGLESAMVYPNSRYRTSFVARGQRLLPVPEGFSLLGPSRIWPFLRSPAISWPGKARAALEVCVPRRDEDASDESIGSFVRRRFGREVYSVLAEPVVRGVASGHPDELSMRAVLPQFIEMEARYGSVLRGLRVRRHDATASGARYGLFASFHGGMQRLPDRVLRSLDGEDVRLGTEAVRLIRDDRATWTVELASGAPLAADAVCLATPVARAAALVQHLDQPLADQLRAIQSSSWITVALAFRAAALRRPVNGFGCVVPSSEGWPITGCTFTHVKFPERAPAGHALFRTFLSDDGSRSGAGLSDRDAVAVSRRFLAWTLGADQPPLFAEVFRAPGALPQYQVGHLSRLAAIEARLHAHPGLVLAGNAHAGHGVAKCVRSAERAAAKLFDALAVGVTA